MRVFATAVVLYVMALLPCFLALFFVFVEKSTFSLMLPGILTGLVGILVGWLSWWGAVEPLPDQKRVAEQGEEQEGEQMICGICGGPIEESVLQYCTYQCGRYFHKGCYAASASVYRGRPGFCHVCKNKVGA